MQTCPMCTSYWLTGNVLEHIQKLNAVWCRCISEGQCGSSTGNSLQRGTAQGMLPAHDYAAEGAACNPRAAADAAATVVQDG